MAYKKEAASEREIVRNSDTAGHVLVARVLLLLATLLVVSALTVAALVARGSQVSQAIENTGAGTTLRLSAATGDDSWKPMALAHARHAEGGGLYSTFFDDGVKFQYPPSALLPFAVMPEGFLPGPESVSYPGPFNRLASRLSLLAVMGTLAVSICILLQQSRTSLLAPPSITQQVAMAGAYGLFGLGFYPLAYAHELGQIQVFLNFFLAAALLAWATGMPAVAGALAGICALIKPQYGLVLVWLPLARHWSAAVWMCVTVAAGLIASIAVFGWHDHIDYLRVLGRLSRHGEAFWANQSVNGLMHRLTGNGDVWQFSATTFPPYSPLVHGVTIVSSVLVLGLALATARWTAAGRYRASPFGFGAILAGITIASPIAWEHHYGFFVALIALLLPWDLQPVRARGWCLLLPVAAVFMAVSIPVTTFASGATAVVLSAHLFLGGAIILGMLIWASREARPGKAGATAA